MFKLVNKLIPTMRREDAGFMQSSQGMAAAAAARSPTPTPTAAPVPYTRTMTLREAMIAGKPVVLQSVTPKMEYAKKEEKETKYNVLSGKKEYVRPAFN